MAQLELRESEELREDREYLNRMAAALEKEGYHRGCAPRLAAIR